MRRGGSILLLALLVAGLLPLPVRAAPVTQTVTLTVAVPADDVTETNRSSVALTEGTLAVGRPSVGTVTDIGLRFPNCPVPPGAVIEEAHLTVTSYTYGNSDKVKTVFRGLMAPDLPAFSSTSRPSQVAKTTSAVLWAPGNWRSNTAYNSPNLRALVQEIVAQAGWRQGSAIGVAWEDTGTVSYRSRTIYSRDFWQTSARGARLSITYTYDPSPGSDVNPPAVHLTSPLAGASVSGMVAVSADATDDQSVASVGFYADGALLTTDTTPPYGCTWDTAGYASGSHTLTARAVDLSGNASTDSLTCTVLDLAPPVVSAFRAVAVGSDSVSLSWSTNEPATSRVEYGLTTPYDSSTTTDTALVTSHSVTVSGLASGTTYHLRAVSADASGNRGISADLATTTAAPAPSGRTTVVVDLLSPYDDVVEVNDASLRAMDGFLEVGKSGGSSSTDVGLRFPNAAVPKGAVVAEAHLILTAYSYGVAENVSSVFRGLKSYSAFSGTSRPSQMPKTAASVGWAPASWTPETVYGSPDLRGIVQEIVDQPDWSEGRPIALVWEDAGTPAWQGRFVYSHDEWRGPTLGPRLSVTYSYDAAPDVTSPSVAITSPAAGALVTGAVPISAAASDDRGVAEVGFYVDGTLIASDTASPYACTWDTTRWAAGNHTVLAKAVDSAGNDALDTVTCQVWRDATPPVITGVSASPGAHSATIRWTTDEPATSIVRYGKSTSLGYSTADTTPVTAHSVVLQGLDASSDYYYTVESSDGSGNTASSAIQRFTTLAAARVPGPPVASFGFDDTCENAYTDAYPVLRSHGFPATEFLVTDEVGTPENLTLAEIRELRDAGWEIGSHTADHAVGIGSSLSAYETSVKRASDWLTANGFTGGGFASPNGAWSHDIVRIVRKYHPYFRIANNTNTGHPYDPYNVSTRFLSAATTISEVRGWLDQAQRNGEWVFFSMHGVSNNGFDTRPQLLEDICRELEARQIPVFTPREIIAADRPPDTTIDCWVDSTQQPVMPTVEAPASLSQNAWNEYWEEYFGYPVVMAMSGAQLPTIRFFRSVPDGTYEVYANLDSSAERRYRYFYSFNDPINPDALHVDTDLFGGDRQYYLGTVTVTNGTFSLYTRRIDSLGTSDWYGAWCWVKLVR